MGLHARQPLADCTAAHELLKKEKRKEGKHDAAGPLGRLPRPYVRGTLRSSPSHGMQETRVEPASRHRASCMGDGPDAFYQLRWAGCTQDDDCRCSGRWRSFGRGSAIGRQSINPPFRIGDRVNVILQHDLLCRVIKAHRRQPAAISLRPGSNAGIDPPVSQEKSTQVLL